MNIVQKFKQGLQKSSGYLSKHIIDSLKTNKINDETLDLHFDMNSHFALKV